MGLKFWDQLIQDKIIREEDPFILHMNFEGAELGVIKDSFKKNNKPKCIISLIGDVFKIYRKENYAKAMEILEEMGVPF